MPLLLKNMLDHEDDQRLDLDPDSHHYGQDSQNEGLHHNNNQPQYRNQYKPSQQQHQSHNSYCLKRETVFKLVEHSIGAIALECGYHVAHQSSLDILTDVCCDYVREITSLLRIACDTEDYRDKESDFVDSLERVFHHINIPSAANLHQFICKVQAIRKHQLKQTQVPPCNTTSTTIIPTNITSSKESHQDE